MGYVDLHQWSLAGVIIDSHVHVMPDRVLADPQSLAVRDPWFALCHPPGKTLASITSLLADMDEDGVDRSVCFTWPFADPDLCREANDFMAAAQTRHPDRLIGFGIVNPASPDAAAEVERCAQLGLRGIGELNADAQGWSFEGPEIAAVAERAAALGMVINLHVSERPGHDFAGRGTAWPSRLLIFADRFPQTRVVASHLGAGLPFFARLPEVSQVMNQIWMDTSAAPFLYTAAGVAACLQAGAGRVMYGSDYPLLRWPRYRKLFDEAGLEPAAEAALLSGSALELFGSE